MNGPVQSRRSGERLVRMKADDDRFGLKAGDVLAVIPYWLDPAEKWTVLRRVSDGFDPGCNVYRDQVVIAR